MNAPAASPAEGARIITRLDAAPALASLWAACDKGSPFHAGQYQDYMREAQSDDREARLVLHEGAGAPFILERKEKSFFIGERRVFSTPLTALSLTTPWLFGPASQETIAEMFDALNEQGDFDWINLGETPIDSALHDFAQAPGAAWITSRGSRKISKRWLIDLPSAFDDYLQLLSSKTRQSTKRKMRKLEKNYETELLILKDPDDVDAFLKEGEAISRKTYQWHSGQRLNHDEATRDAFRALLEKDRLRFYLLRVDGAPAAFLRGVMFGARFHYETPGFDPAYGKDSIGTVLLMYALRDLIERGDAEVFDFGTGGDETGYKSTYGTRSIDCAFLELGRRASARAKLVAAAQASLNGAKAAADRVLGQGDLRRRVKKLLRRYDKG